MEGSVYENIVKVRQQQIAWAEQAAKHMLKLDDETLDLVSLPEESAAFRAALAFDHGSLIVIAAMDCLASTITGALLRSDTLTPAFALISLFPVIDVSVHYHHGEVVLDAHTTFDVDASILELEVRFNLYEGRTVLFDALAHVLRESPPPSWGLVEFERYEDRPNRLTAKLFDKYVDPPEM